LADRPWPSYQNPIKNRRRAARYRKPQKTDVSRTALRARRLDLAHDQMKRG
jgi:hypothetical protein